MSYALTTQRRAQRHGRVPFRGYGFFGATDQSLEDAIAQDQAAVAAAQSALDQANANVAAQDGSDMNALTSAINDQTTAVQNLAAAAQVLQSDQAALAASQNQPLPTLPAGSPPMPGFTPAPSVTPPIVGPSAPAPMPAQPGIAAPKALASSLFSGPVPWVIGGLVVVGLLAAAAKKNKSGASAR